MAERYDIKPIPLAAAINAYNEDVGRISATNCDLLMDRHVIIAQRKKYRSENKPDRSNFSGLYFDGKKDKTIQKRGPYKCEEHITIISEPGSHYITHTRPASSKSDSVAESITNALTDDELASILVIGSDGTSCNTGVNKGVITRIESHLDRKLHWNVCINQNT